MTIPEAGKAILARVQPVPPDPTRDYVAIDVDTERMYWGSSIVEVTKLAKAVDPAARIYVARIGYPGVVAFRSR